MNPFPVPQRYGGTAADNDLNANRPEGETFDIRTTSAADAQKIYEEHQKRQDEKDQENQDDFGTTFSNFILKQFLGGNQENDGFGGKRVV